MRQSRKRKITELMPETEFVSRSCDDCSVATQYEDRRHSNLCHSCYLKRAKQRNAKFRESRRKIVKDWLAGAECAICGLSDPLTLEWAHNDRSEKLGDVSEMITHRRLSAAREEIEKCTVKCGNCHCKETHDENRSYRSKYMADGTLPTSSHVWHQKRFILEYLISNPCVICGETDVRCLDFDHLETAGKCFNICETPKRRIDLIKEEIRKTQVLCRNHHKCAAVCRIPSN